MNRQCPECGGRNIYIMHNRKEKVCNDCGLILDDCLIEERQFIDEGRKNHATNPYLSIASGKGVDGKIFKDSWLYSTKEKNFQSVCEKIDFVVSRLRLTSNISKEACLLFKSVIDRDINIGRDNNSLLYACVYISCIMHGVPRTPLEITAFTDIKIKKLMKAYKIIKHELNLNLENIQPIDLVQRFGSRANLKQSTITKAIDIFVKINNNIIFSGKNPQTLVASALYLASKITNEGKTQREIANATGVIEVTIRKRSREIESVLV